MRQKPEDRTRSRLNVLVLADYDPGNAAVVSDFLYSFDRHSKHAYFYRFHPHRLHPDFDFDRFDVIVVFWSIWMAPPEGVPPSIPAEVTERIRDSCALKAVFLQDEYRAVRPINRALANLGTNLMFTCVAEDQHELFYPAAEIPTLRGVRSVLTGYVPDYLKQPRFRQKLRPLTDIGYRSRQVPYALGHIGQEKTEVADRFQQIAAQYGFSANISVREADRIYGRYWFDFLRSTRFQLGTPSGASVIDFDGSRWSQVKRFHQKHPLVSYDEVHKRFLAELEGKHVIDTISPRFFEYAATMNTMVLHEGHYAGILRADEHYIEVKKDYSNIDDVVARMRDDAFCARLRKTSYDDLIASGRFSYAQFVRCFDEAIEQEAGAGSTPPLSALTFYREQYANAGQYVAAHRGKEIVVPVGTGLIYWRRRLTDKMVGALPIIGRAIKRRGGRPTVKFARGMATLRAAFKRQPIRKALLRSMLFPRKGVSRYALMKEFALLCIIDQMQRDTVPVPQHFVIPTLDQNASVLKLQTYNRKAFPDRLARWRRNEMASVSTLLDTPGINEFEWHLPKFAAGMFLNGYGRTWFERESGGIYHFREIPHLLQEDPDLFKPMMMDVLRYENVHKRFRRASRPTVFGLQLPIPELQLQLARKDRVGRWAMARAAAALSTVRADRRSLLFLLRCIVGYRPLRRYCVYVLSHRRHFSGRRALVNELKLMTALVGYLRFGAKSSDRFHVTATVSGGTLKLTSREGAVGRCRRDRSDVTDTRADKLPLSQVETVVWDHSAVAYCLRWQTPNQPEFQSVVGENGVLRLTGLEHFVMDQPAQALALIDTIARHEPCDRSKGLEQGGGAIDGLADVPAIAESEQELKRSLG